MRTLQHGTSNDLVILYLCGTHIDAAIRRALGPSPRIVAFDDKQGVAPNRVADRHVRSLVLVGYSAGCQAVRAALREGTLPIADRLGVVAIDGTHASIPPQPWQLDVWRTLAEQARRRERLFVATCTAQVYTESLPPGQRFLSTLSVLRQSVEPSLVPLTPPDDHHDGDLHVHAYPSKAIDAAAHIAQQRDVLPTMLEQHVRPWLDRVHAQEPRTSLGDRAADVALSYVGWREVGPNKGDLVRRSLAGCVRDGKPLGIVDGVAWCAGFVGLCDHLAAMSDEARPPWRAAVRELVQDAIEAGAWRDVGAYVPRRGDLAVFKRDGRDPRAGAEGHVERIVVEPDASQWVESVGGNVNDMVARRRWRIGYEPIGHELVGWIVRSEATMSVQERAQVDGAIALSLDQMARTIA